jgi:hypothetical protein
VKGQEKVAKDIRRLEAMQRYAAPQHNNVLQPLITVISRYLGSSPSALHKQPANNIFCLLSSFHGINPTSKKKKHVSEECQFKHP